MYAELPRYMHSEGKVLCPKVFSQRFIAFSSLTSSEIQLQVVKAEYSSDARPLCDRGRSTGKHIEKKRRVAFGWWLLLRLYLKCRQGCIVEVDASARPPGCGLFCFLPPSWTRLLHFSGNTLFRLPFYFDIEPICLHMTRTYRSYLYASSSG